MATLNPFDLLGDDDNDDPSRLISIQQEKVAAAAAAAAKKNGSPAGASTATRSSPVAKFPAKPTTPAQAVKEARNNAGPPSRGSQGRFFSGRGRGGRSGGFGGPNRELADGDMNGSATGYGTLAGGEDLYAGKPSERGRGGYGSRGSFRGGRRGGYRNEEGHVDSERPSRRMYERHSGTGRGYEMKREGAGCGNWGTTKDDVIAQETEEIANVEEKDTSTEKQPKQENEPSSEENKVNNETQANESEEKEPEDKEMTLDEYEKIKEEKRKALLAIKSEERKVELDKELESMQQLSSKKGNDDIFVKLGTGKDTGKKKENADREERAKKSINITEFLKPAEGERYYAPGGRGRGRGRGRGDRGGYSRGDYGSSVAPSIEDSGQFPSLGAK